LRGTRKFSPYGLNWVLPALLGRHERSLFEDAGGWGLLGHKRQLQVTDDPVRDLLFREKGDAIHPAAEPGRIEPLPSPETALSGFAREGSERIRNRRLFGA
jgi:hypothetical protein